MLSFESICLDLGGRVVLSDVSLEVQPPGVTMLLGPNGAGKSSLLRIAAGELKPKSGQVRVLGCPLPKWDTTSLARQRAILPQSSTLSFGFTVMEVVLLGRIPHGTSNRRDGPIAEAALAEVGLAGFEERSYLALSGGERQRVQLARVLAQIWPGEEGQLLLLDEPTAALDLVYQHQMLALGEKMAARGVTVLVVLHDLNLAAQYAHRLALMDRGRLVAEGTPDAILRTSVLEPVFRLPLEVKELDSPRQRVVLAKVAPHENMV